MSEGLKVFLFTLACIPAAWCVLCGIGMAILLIQDAIQERQSKRWHLEHIAAEAAREAKRRALETQS